MGCASALQVTSVTNGAYKPIYMNGKEVFKFATTRVPKVTRRATYSGCNNSMGIHV